MMWLLLRMALWAGLSPSPELARAMMQDQSAPQAESTEIISGTITEVAEGRIVVSRAVLGKPAENRSFYLTTETKIEGNLRVGARVTVGYKTTEEGDLAVRIIVRPGGNNRKD